MSDGGGQMDADNLGRDAPFADDPSKAQWIGLLRDLSAELVEMELEASRITERASNMRSRIDMISQRLSD